VAADGKRPYPKHHFIRPRRNEPSHSICLEYDDNSNKEEDDARRAAAVAEAAMGAQRGRVSAALAAAPTALAASPAPPPAVLAAALAAPAAGVFSGRCIESGNKEHRNCRRTMARFSAEGLGDALNVMLLKSSPKLSAFFAWNPSTPTTARSAERAVLNASHAASKFSTWPELRLVPKVACFKFTVIIFFISFDNIPLPFKKQLTAL
jgi:hypothetical protein